MENINNFNNDISFETICHNIYEPEFSEDDLNFKDDFDRFKELQFFLKEDEDIAWKDL